MLEAMSGTGAGYDSVQMVESTIIRAYQHAGGSVKTGFRTRVFTARGMASLPRFHSAAMLTASLSRLPPKFGLLSEMQGDASVMQETRPRLSVLLADRGYEADFVLSDLETRAVEAVIQD